MKVMNRNSQPIGVFDSGIGGLSIAAHLLERLPNEQLLYFGDSARVPYGSKSPETVQLYTRQAVRMLQARGAKLITIACNSASAVAIQEARRVASVPILGVIRPGAEAAVGATKNGRVGVIGTAATIRSGAYGREISSIDSSVEVYSQPSPLLVGFAEEGLVRHPATRLMVSDYLSPLLSHNVDTIVLGCTHYPILREMISGVAGDRVELVDPGAATALEVESILKSADMIRDTGSKPAHKFILSDLPDRFIEVGERFLGRSIGPVEKIQLEELIAFS